MTPIQPETIPHASVAARSTGTHAPRRGRILRALRRAVRPIALAVCAATPLAPARAAIVLPPVYDHVVIVIMENKTYGEVIGSAYAPYINALAAQGALFTSSYAIGHPSEPNYLELYSGSNQGITDDSCPHTFAGVDNLGSQLIGASLTFAGYSEDLPAEGSTVCSSGLYFRKHNPWVNFDNVPSASNKPYSAFPSDFSTLPTLSFVVPNQCNDMHNSSNCPISPSVASGDTWLQNNIDDYAQWAKTHDSLLIVTWDEDDGTSGNHNRIATFFVGAMVVPGQYDETINHYTVLATLEAMYGLPAIAGAAAKTPIADVWDTTVFRDGFE
jgi:phosphatidylinositol-3-phosphatase